MSNFGSWVGQQPYPSGKLDPYGPFVNPYSPASLYRTQQLQAQYGQQQPGQWSSQANPAMAQTPNMTNVPGRALGPLTMPLAPQTPWTQMQPGQRPAQDVIGDQWLPTRPEMGAAFYRHAAASPGAVGSQYWLDLASQAYENPLGHLPGAVPPITDAFGNQRFDYNPQMGGQFGYGTGQYNPGDRTHPGGLSTAPIRPIATPTLRPASPVIAPSMRPSGSTVSPPSRITAGPPRSSR